MFPWKGNAGDPNRPPPLTAPFVGPQEPLQATVQLRKLALFGHVTRLKSLCKTVLQGT
ncbi:hypothetical protein DPMN_104770 [Dreissena polymorpha]|uniref:Uncharacterized protein n=1 Tax=Dreissena polymorpha TaxID=45954 RepID=A0A9D4K2V8_DREPO|nr:hypothetical protein DPMN_104770 [Dreissena polymorpha]